MTTTTTSSIAHSMMQSLVSYPTLLQHETELQSRPYDVNQWCLYLSDIDDEIQQHPSLKQARAWVGQRCITLLPASYKLWRMHLAHLKQCCNTKIVIEAYESCLIRLHKAPRIWIEYLEHLLQNSKDVTLIRRTFDRSLTSLSVAQHDKIWNLYLEKFLVLPNIPSETTLRVWRRAILYNPLRKHDFVQVCIQLKKYTEASLLLLDLLNDASLITTTTSRHELWTQFCQVVSVNSIEAVDFDGILRSLLNNKDTKEMEGTLWTQLADYYTRKGEFEMARSVYEEALEKVSRVRDFSIVFDAYVGLEEKIMEAMMELEEEEEDENDDTSNQQDDDNDWDLLLGQDNDSSSGTTMADMELALARAEHLTTVRRPLLLNRVLLRQNPHNVGEWIARADLYLKQNQNELAAAALKEALQKVDSKRAVNGLVYTLVTKLAKDVYKDNPKEARRVYQGICDNGEYEFARMQDLAQCFAAWVELELAQEQWDDALAIVRRATTPSKQKKTRHLYKSTQLWDLLLDLEESLGTLATTKDAYNRALDLKVATPMHVLNYASFLHSQGYFEESFAAYERGVELFDFPASKILWNKYLKAFVERYKGGKMERARDLFERCLESCPAQDASEFFMMQGELEEQYGLTKRALGVYQKMCMTVPPEEKASAYRLLIAKTQLYLGIPATRNVYQQAIENLQDRPAAEVCLEFAKTETQLHETDRARAVLKYGAQLADPRRHPEYWKTWHLFEVSHGNEETFRDMLRIKRSVQAAFSTVNYNAAEMSGEKEGDDTLTDEQALSMIADREGVTVENKPRIGGFVQAKRTAELAELGEVENRVAKLRKATAHVDVKQQQQQSDDAEDNDEDEIDLDEDDGEEEEEEETPTTGAVRSVSTKAIPSAVFGGLKSDESSSADTKMGALERLRAAASSGKSGANDSPQ